MGIRKGIKLTPRDKNILRFLFENKMATTKDIQHKFFGPNARRNTTRRLIKLRQAGLIKMDCDFILKSIYFYFLTPTGLRTIYPQADDFHKRHIKSADLLHDSKLAELRKVFSSSPFIHEYYTKNMLLMEPIFPARERIFIDDYNKISPDAIFITKTQTRTVYNAIQLELMQRPSYHYIDMIHKYRFNEPVIRRGLRHRNLGRIS